MKIKVEWCKNFIIKTFAKYPIGTGIERNLFFEMAEASGLFVKDTYGSPMSHAITDLIKVEPIIKNGKLSYYAFRLK